MNLMNSIIFKKKLITEKDLYKDRERRFKRNNKTIMSPILFNILDKLVRIFKNVFI
tara:strand:- start:478 stop:645 length:168 start_codon:yes stop_codon:yes gene_type:complete